MTRSPFRITLIIVAFVSLAPCYAYASATVLFVSVDDTDARVSSSLAGSDRATIKGALDDGLKSEIVFQFRLYKKNTGFFSFMGDILLFEKTAVRFAYKDLFKNQYIIQSNDETTVYTDESEFMDRFFSLAGYVIGFPESLSPGEYSILGRITVNPVKLEPPLHIVSLITPIGTTTAWTEYKFAREAR